MPAREIALRGRYLAGEERQPADGDQDPLQIDAFLHDVASREGTLPRSCWTDSTDPQRALPHGDAKPNCAVLPVAGDLCL
jgi:hypothetical protein